MQAKNSIDILGWELSLSFGLVQLKQTPKNHLLDRIQQRFTQGSWKSLQVRKHSIKNRMYF